MSQSGTVTICGFAALENPHQYDKHKPSSLAFDTQFHLGPGTNLLGRLRYFNEHGKEFDDVGCYMICANIAQTQPGAQLGEELVSQLDWQVVGDIIWLVPVSVTKDQLRQHRPWITVAATVLKDSINEDEGSFRVDAFQYTHANKPATNHPSILPIKATFSKKFSKNPMPKPHSNITLEGYLTRYSETNNVATCFYVDVEKIVFQGRAYTPPSPPNKAGETSCTKRKRGLKFSFDDDDDNNLFSTSTPSKHPKLSASDSCLTAGMTPVSFASSQ